MLQRCGVGEINSVWGRGWGKDRDNRLPRAPALARSALLYTLHCDGARQRSEPEPRAVRRWKRIEAAFRSLVEGTAAVHIRLP